MKGDSNPTIRACTRDDIEALGLVGAATFLETFAGVLDGRAIVAHCAQAHDPHRYRELIGLGCQAWLAEVAPDRAPIGYALVGPSLLTLADPGEIDLKRLYVMGYWHGSGVGSALLEQAVDHARAGGHHRLLVGVYVGNARAIAFYRRHGFEQVGDRVFNVGQRTYDDLVFARKL